MLDPIYGEFPLSLPIACFPILAIREGREAAEKQEGSEYLPVKLSLNAMPPTSRSRSPIFHSRALGAITRLG